MNSDEGIFEHYGPNTAGMETLAVGEIVEIKGEKLRVTEIKKRKVTLELMSIDDRFAEAVAGINRHERRRIEKMARSKS